jgi:hypothetical protein
MYPNDPHRTSDDLQPVADFLRANRPEATALELDAVKRQVLNRARKGTTTMKSRLAMMAMLVFGLLMSGTGAGLAITGLSSNGDASIAQYGTTETTPDEQGTLPTSTSGGTSCDTDGDGVISPSEAASGDCGEVQGRTDENTDEETIAPAPDEDTPTAREEAAQPTRQTEASGGDELPFTGFAAVPILIGGIALMAGGLVLRRRTAAE